MVRTQKRVRRQALKISFAAVVFAALGAAVVAAPFALNQPASSVHMAMLTPLASGPAIQLAHAGAGESEDCVRITKMTGPDGKVYPTRGIVCGGAE